MKNGFVFNIMHYSIHDGPGIRTTVFFKGCPLSCKWCHNPESQSNSPQKVFNAEKCIKCGHCDGIFDADCPTGARETIGYEITVAELMKEIIKDRLFYEQSGGGVTFSGGEPFCQPEFLMEVLSCCKKECINIAVDTSGHCDTDVLLEAAETVGYFLYDIKFINPKKHEQYCGVSNKLILKNLERLSGTKAKLLIRIPVIPGINNNLKEMAGIFNYIKGIKNIETVHLLPYHNIHAGKYKKIGKQYEYSENPGTGLTVNDIKDIFAGNFQTIIGG